MSPLGSFCLNRSACTSYIRFLEQSIKYWCHSPVASCAPLNSHGIALGIPVAVAPMRPTSPTASVGDYDILTIGRRTDRFTLSAAVHLLGKYSDIADVDAAGLGYDVGRDSNVRVIEDLDVAYLNVHQPIPDSGCSLRSGEAQRQSPSHNQSYHATLYPLHMIGSLTTLPISKIYPAQSPASAVEAKNMP